jgi:hypothetical protein
MTGEERRRAEIEDAHQTLERLYDQGLLDREVPVEVLARIARRIRLALQEVRP